MTQSHSEDLEKCKICGKSFPDHLVQPMVTSNGYYYACPICALKERNRIHGIPEDTPFQGEIANDMWEEAVQYLKESKQ